jgi:MFS family permease
VDNLTNLQWATAYAVYGGVAMAAYLLGGPLADRFNPRGMLFIALLSTGGGALVLLGQPSPLVVTLLYAWWGLTTIALFWAPLIKATREWGGDKQGIAFGLRDGGRGLLAALTATLLVAVVARLYCRTVRRPACRSARRPCIRSSCWLAASWPRRGPGLVCPARPGTRQVT